MNSKDFNEQNNNLINSNEMKNNDLLASNEFMFNFNKGKFLWKELMKINTKYINLKYYNYNFLIYKNI